MTSAVRAPSFEAWVNTVEANHLTARDDRSFHFVDFETGYIHVDYVDPAIPDVTQRRTETFTVNLTPGGTYTETLHLPPARRQFRAGSLD